MPITGFVAAPNGELYVIVGTPAPSAVGPQPEPILLVGGIPASGLPAATTTVAGVVKKTAARADDAALTAIAAVGAAPDKAEYDALLADVTALRTVVNDLLAKLRTAGIVTT